MDTPEKITPNPEMDIIEQRAEAVRRKLEKERVPSEQREKEIKQEIKSYLRELQQTPPTVAPLATRDEADEIKKFPVAQQVGALVSLVFEKGLKEAIEVARNLDNPAILDEFHDTLVDRYYEELVEKGIISQ